jgi:hypothetical protein
MISYVTVSDGDESSIIVFVPGRSPLLAHSSHPRYAEIVQGAKNGDESIIALFDLAETAGEKFEQLTDRVTVEYGRLYLDGEEVHDALAAQVVRFLDEGEEDWKPLVRFLEKVSANPSRHSRTQLYEWLARRDFTITDAGDIVGYKGVTRNERGDLVSINHGRAIVNGEEHVGAIPNPLGAVVSMPRSEVEDNPAEGCSYGLHVGTYSYASGWARGALLEVHVNPADVVSVPTDCDAAKLRTCQYTVVKTIDAPHAEAVSRGYYDDGDDVCDCDREWGDGEEDSYDPCCY